MALKQALSLGAILILGAAAMALPEPHKGMIDNEFVRDVGVVFSKPNFQGDKKFIFEIKDESACQVFAGDLPSVRICKSDVQCNFFTGSNCEVSQSNYAIGIGCGDVAQVSTPVGNYFKHYKCGKVGQLGNVNQTIKTVPHDATADEAEAMGN